MQNSPQDTILCELLVIQLHVANLMSKLVRLYKFNVMAKM